MAYIYKTSNGQEQKFNNETVAFKQSSEIDTNLEGFVKAGIMVRQDVLDNEVIAGEDLDSHLELTIGTDGKGYVATNATQKGIGSCATSVKKDNTTKGVNFPVSINKAGSEDIVASGDVVIGAGGRLVNYKGALVSLASAVTSLAEDHFNNTVLAPAKRLKVKTDADDTTARGSIVTIYGIDQDKSFVKENVVLDGSDSSTAIETVNTYSKVLAFSINQSVTTADLVITNTSNDTVKIVTTPVSTKIYGAVATDDSDNTLGHSIKIASTVAPVLDAVLGVIGTDEDNNFAYETMVFDGVALFKMTTKPLKTITHILVGDSVIADYSATILANTVDQKIGSNFLASVITAGKLFMVKR